MILDRLRIRCLILRQLFLGEVEGRELRRVCNAHNAQLDLADFYHIMSQLEDSGDVVGHWQKRLVEGVEIKYRVYRLVRRDLCAVAHVRRCPGGFV